MYVVAAFMAVGLAGLPETRLARRLVTGYVNDWQVTVLGPAGSVRRGPTTCGDFLEWVISIGLDVNNAKMALVCDDRKTAIQLATSVGAPVLTGGMFKCKNLGGYVAPLRERRWRQTGSVFTQRLRKAARRAARFQQLRRAPARGSERLYKTGIRPVSEYAMGLHGVSPSEMERVERLAVRAFPP